MKRTKVLILISVIVSCLSIAYMAYGSIALSGHDLSNPSSKGSYMGMNDYGEICVYCHTPHGANTSIGAPLWNRNTPPGSGSYTVYTSATMTTSPSNPPSGVSLACLSCHDGTIAVDQIINAPGSGNNATGPWHGNTAVASHYQLNSGGCGGCHTGYIFDTNVVSIGTDLSNDHPISMTYPSTDTTNFKATPDAGIKLFNGKVECPSCHDVHNDSGFQPFLRVNNAGSALCLGCHVK